MNCSSGQPTHPLSHHLLHHLSSPARSARLAQGLSAGLLLVWAAAALALDYTPDEQLRRLQLQAQAADNQTRQQALYDEISAREADCLKRFVNAPCSEAIRQDYAQRSQLIRLDDARIDRELRMISSAARDRSRQSRQTENRSKPRQP